MGDTVAVPVLLPDVSVSDLFRRHLGAGVCTGRLPVVKTSSRRATLLRRALLHNDNRKPLPGRRNRCKTPRKAAAQHQHITPDDLLLAHLIPIRPAVFSMLHIAFFSLFHSNIFHRQPLFKESYPHLPQNYHFPQPKLPGFAIQPRVSVSNQVFMWRRGRNSWFAEICVIHRNPLSERSELWISVNAFSRFRQTLVFRPAATETRLETGARGVLEATLFIFPPPGNKPQNAPVQPPGEEYPPSGTHPSQTDTSPQTGIPASDSQGS